MVRGFLGSELFRLEDVIGNLNKKIDIIGDRVTKRPNQLARASLMAGMTSTFGDLQNTIELLNKKLDRRLDPNHTEMMMSSDPRKSVSISITYPSVFCFDFLKLSILGLSIILYCIKVNFLN